MARNPACGKLVKQNTLPPSPNLYRLNHFHQKKNDHFTMVGSLQLE
jgi:hypothetical protein